MNIKNFFSKDNLFGNIIKKDNNSGIESDIINNIKNDIKSGTYPLEILEGKQGKHNSNKGTHIVPTLKEG